MMKSILPKLLCFILTAAIMFSFSQCGSAQSALSQESPVSADQEQEPVKDFDSDNYYTRLLKCAEQIRAKTDFKPDVALVLGSGLGYYTQQLNIVATIPYT